MDGQGTAYRPFVRALHARHDTLSFDDLFGLLLSKEIQLKRDDTSSSSLNVAANVAQK